MDSPIYNQWQQWETRIQTWLNQSDDELKLLNTSSFDRVILTILCVKYHLLYEDMNTVKRSAAKKKNEDRLATIQLSKTKASNTKEDQERHRDREKTFDNFTGRFLSPQEVLRETSPEWQEFNELCDWHGLRFVRRFGDCLSQFLGELIGSTPAYQELIKKRPIIPSVNSIPNEVYNIKHDNQVFISIDMKSANFSLLQCMHAIDAQVYPTWADFLSTFVGSKPFLIHNKKLRMRCLGKLPEFYKLEALWTDYTATIYRKILLRCFDDKEIDARCVALCGDEVIFHLDCTIKTEQVLELVDFIQQRLIKESPIVKFAVQAYRLRSFYWKQKHMCFARRFIDKK